MDEMHWNSNGRTWKKTVEPILQRFFSKGLIMDAAVWKALIKQLSNKKIKTFNMDGYGA